MKKKRPSIDGPLINTYAILNDKNRIQTSKTIILYF